ncbi:MAG: TonB C-terminal domain-containing protein [Epsilonproteobacteria bacterium]|nr:TonB C-terminal domain-containing protein [Campylobacterota bacterium]
MPNKSSYSIVGFLGAIVLYISVILFVSFYLQDRVRKNIKYTAQKNVVLDITLVERKSVVKKRVHKKIKKKASKQKKTEKKPALKTVKSKSIKKVSLQGLFKKIQTKKIVEPKPKRTLQSRKKIIAPKKVIQEVEKKKDAKKVVESLNFENKKSIISSKNGVYDKFKGKVTQILDEKWQNTIDTASGNKATVTIFIDNSGTFSYKIEKLSYNDEFNSKLRDFLEEMRDIEFPAYKDSGVFQMQVEFKDIRQ